MLTSLLPGGTTWTWRSVAATDLPEDLHRFFPSSADSTATAERFAPTVEPDMMTGTGAASTLQFPFAGTFSHHQDDMSPVHWIWGTPADVAQFPSLLTELPFGNPLIALRFEIDATPSADAFPSEGISRDMATPPGPPRPLITMDGATAISVGEASIIAVLPRRPGLETLSVLRHLRDALAAGAAAAPAGSALPTLSAEWTGFVAQMDAVEAPLRLLEPSGRPFGERSVTLRRPGEADLAITLAAGDRGDILNAPDLDRSAITAGSTLELAPATDQIAAATSAGAIAGRTADIDATTNHIDIALLDRWFARQSGTLPDFTRRNRVTPFVNGIEFFDEFFTELNDYDPAGIAPVLYLAGYAIDHEGTLVANAAFPERSLQDMVTRMVADGAEARFLALQFLQLDPGTVDDIELAATVTAMILAIAGGLVTFAQDSDSVDQFSFFAHTQAVAAILFLGANSISDVAASLEFNQGAVDALNAAGGVARLDPYPMTIDDIPSRPPLVDPFAAAMNLQDQFGVFRQKLAIVRNRNGIHGYCGGIDLNVNRLDDRDHGVKGPYHDVHARIDGPAVADLGQTFIERWNRGAAPTDPTLALDAPGAFDGLAPAGGDIVQIARTYFGPGATTGGPRALPFATSGDRTLLDTMIAAIGQARRYIYIEDQYATPPREYARALEQAAGRVSGPLILVLPETPDQPFGLAPRQTFIDGLRATWGERLHVGTMRSRFHRAQTTRKKALGRLWLTEDITESSETVRIGPPDRLPGTPFWMTVDKEAMYVTGTVASSEGPDGVAVRVIRGARTQLFAPADGSEPGIGTEAKSHKAGAAALGGRFAGIYVHSKITLIDDCFACIGSANLNKRGLYSDGECNLFAIPDTLGYGDNWIRALRTRLMSELMGVEEEYGAVAFQDPGRHLGLFEREFTQGNRFAPFGATPFSLEGNLSASFLQDSSAIEGIGFLGIMAASMAVALAGLESDAIWENIIDPSSGVAGI